MCLITFSIFVSSRTYNSVDLPRKWITFFCQEDSVSRVGIHEYKEKKIIEVDLSKCSPQETITTINEAIALIKTQPRNSVLLLTDVTDAVQNKDSVAAIKDFALSNVHFVRASAVVGVDESKQPVLATVRFLTLHEIKQASNTEEAKEYLVQK